jgi:uncharacterized protein
MYLPRIVDRVISEVSDPNDGVPAVLVVGPRSCGKTTTALAHSRSALRLDRPTERGVALADPDAAIAVGDRPLLIDEWQLAPEVLGAVKRAVDVDFSPAQFILTGSARADLLEPGWAGTGRVVRLAMWGLTERELNGDGATTGFLPMAGDRDAEMPSVVDAPDVRAYVGQALRGGLPQVATSSSPARRARLLDAYVDQLVTREVELSGSRSNPSLLRTYLRALAASSAGSPSTERLIQATGIDRATTQRYDGIFESLMISERRASYGRNRLSRIASRPKRYLTEPALLGPLLGIDERLVMRDADLLGRLIDTYVMAQLRPELELIVPKPQLLHLRDTNGDHEIDLVVEYPDGSVLGIEIKADANPGREAGRHLRWLSEQLGADFRRGIVFHTGPRSFQYEPSIWYLPISTIWTSPRAA